MNRKQRRSSGKENKKKQVETVQKTSNPSELTGVFDRAMQSVNQKDYAKALEILLDLSQQDSDNVDVWHNIAFCYFQINDLSEAETAIEKANKIDNGRVLTLSLQGAIYKKQNKINKAIKAFKQALALEPDNISVINNLALTYQDADKLVEAKEYYKKAYKLEPRNPSILANLGRLRYKLEEYDEAEDFLKQAIDAAPNNISALNTLARTYLKRGNNVEAIAILKQAMAIDPNNLKCMVTLADVFIALDDHVTAARTYEQAIALHNPQEEQIYCNLAKTYAELKRYDDLIRAAAQVLNVVTDLKGNKTILDLHNIFVKHNVADRLLDDVEWLLGKFPDSPEAYAFAGSMHSNAYSLNQAVKYILKSIELNPDQQSVYNNLGTTYLRLAQYDKAKESFQKLLSFEEAYPDAYHTLGFLAFGEGKIQQHYNWVQWRHFISQPSSDLPTIKAPEWTGQDLNGKSLYVYAEQGAGDQIQNFRWINTLQKRYKNLTLHVSVHIRLVDICSKTYPDVMFHPLLVEETYDDHECDYSCALFDIPLILKLYSAEDHMVDGAYLDIDKTISYKTNPDDLVIGVAWFSANPRDSKPRSVDPIIFDQIRQASGEPDRLKFVCLQYNPDHEHLAQVKSETGLDIYIDPNVDQMENMSDFAAQLKACDLVISIDNTTVHYAGALGVPTWALLSKACNWRWFYDGQSSIWYPSLRLFRQNNIDDWSNVITDVCTAFKDHLAEKKDLIPSDLTPATALKTIAEQPCQPNALIIHQDSQDMSLGKLASLEGLKMQLKQDGYNPLTTSTRYYGVRRFKAPRKESELNDCKVFHKFAYDVFHIYSLSRISDVVYFNLYDAMTAHDETAKNIAYHNHVLNSFIEKETVFINDRPIPRGYERTQKIPSTIKKTYETAYKAANKIYVTDETSQKVVANFNDQSEIKPDTLLTYLSEEKERNERKGVFVTLPKTQFKSLESFLQQNLGLHLVASQDQKSSISGYFMEISNNTPIEDPMDIAMWRQNISQANIIISNDYHDIIAAHHFKTPIVAVLDKNQASLQEICKNILTESYIASEAPTDSDLINLIKMPPKDCFLA